MFDLACHAPGVADTLRCWPLETMLGMPLATVLADPDLPFLSRLAQPLIVAATLAAWEALRPLVPAPALVAGYSIGELSAHAIAGTIGPADAISLAAERAALMDLCVQVGVPQSLLAISGRRIEDVQTSLDAHCLHVAIVTGADSFIVGGAETSLAAFRSTLAGFGVQCTALRVGVASHTPLMQGAAVAFADVLRQYRLADPAIPVLAGISGDRVRRGADVAAVLSAQMAHTIRWTDCMDAFSESGIEVGLELGPGSALSRMLKARHPHMTTRSVADFRSVSGVVEWLDKQLDS